MKTIRKWARDLFGFSGNEINGFLILIPIMLIAVASEPLFSAYQARQARIAPEDQAIFDSLVDRIGQAYPENEPKILVQFDPNSASEDELSKLGFPPILAKRIVAYRRKGGSFRIKSDLLKIYGFDSSLYNHVYPFISLRSAHTTPGKPGQGKRLTSIAQPSFDLNKADTTELKRIYGIGSKLAARIIKYREMLGGFISIDQLSEVYGLDSVVIGRLARAGHIDANFTPRKININTADEAQLGAHPYIRWRIAKSLVTYRFQHGKFSDASEVENIVSITTQEALRLKPYISVSD